MRILPMTVSAVITQLEKVNSKEANYILAFNDVGRDEVYNSRLQFLLHFVLHQ